MQEVNNRSDINQLISAFVTKIQPALSSETFDITTSTNEFIASAANAITDAGLKQVFFSLPTKEQADLYAQYGQETAILGIAAVTKMTNPTSAAQLAKKSWKDMTGDDVKSHIYFMNASSSNALNYQAKFKNSETYKAASAKLRSVMAGFLTEEKVKKALMEVKKKKEAPASTTAPATEEEVFSELALDVKDLSNVTYATNTIKRISRQKRTRREAGKKQGYDSFLSAGDKNYQEALSIISSFTVEAERKFIGNYEICYRYQFDSDKGVTDFNRQQSIAYEKCLKMGIDIRNLGWQNCDRALYQTATFKEIAKKAFYVQPEVARPNIALWVNYLDIKSAQKYIAKRNFIVEKLYDMDEDNFTEWEGLAGEICASNKIDPDVLMTKNLLDLNDAEYRAVVEMAPLLAKFYSPAMLSGNSEVRLSPKRLEWTNTFLASEKDVVQGLTFKEINNNDDLYAGKLMITRFIYETKRKMFGGSQPMYEVKKDMVYSAEVVLDPEFAAMITRSKDRFIKNTNALMGK